MEHEDKAYVKQLIQQLDSNNSVIKDAARDHLIEIGAPAVDLLIDAVRAHRVGQYWEVATILWQVDDQRCLELMKEWLNSGDLVFSGIALDFLARYGDQYLELIATALPGSHLITQMGIVEMLRKMGDKRAVPYLLEVLEKTQSVTMRYIIIGTLGDLGDSQAINVIRRYQDDEDPYVREQVDIALGKLGNGAGH